MKKSIKMRKVRNLVLFLAVLMSSVSAHADTAVALIDGTDYTNRILIVTGRAVNSQSICGLSVDFYNTIAIDKNGGPAIMLEVGFQSADAKPGTRFIPTSVLTCRDSFRHVLLNN